MANYFITGDGTLEGSDGHFVVPVGTTIYFFNPLDAWLESRYSRFFMDQLCRELPNPSAEAYIRALSVEVAPEGERIANRAVIGSDRGSRLPTGVYLVGRPHAFGPVVRILDGVPRTLKDLVSGISEEGSIGTHVYWGVSRRRSRSAIGSSPSQYFRLPSPKTEVTSRTNGKPSYRSAADLKFALTSSGLFREKDRGYGEFVDYPEFREFKARLQSGYYEFD